MENKPKLTLEERLALAAGSQAVSPEAARKRVEQLSKLCTANLFSGRADCDRMHSLTGEFWEGLEEGLLYYGGFCRSFQLAVEADAPPGSGPFQPVLGPRVNNAVVLLGLMLLDHAKGRWKDKEFYHATRMTLGQYLDALEALACPEDQPSSQRFRMWREVFRNKCSPDLPLAQVLEDILKRYIAGWRVLSRIDHISLCIEDLSHELEQAAQAEMDRPFREAMSQAILEMGLEWVEIAEEDERIPDPHGYYLSQARAWNGEVPDLSGEDLAPGTVRDQLFLAGRDYSPQLLNELAAGSPSPELRALLEETIDPDAIASAMGEINSAVTELFMLWIDPYLRMEHPKQE